MALKNLFKSIFGNSSPAEAASEATREESIEYKSFTITPDPIAEGGQFRTAGTIGRTVDGEEKQSTFIRADNHASRDLAIEHSIGKGRQIVDEQGDRLLNSERC